MAFMSAYVLLKGHGTAGCRVATDETSIGDPGGCSGSIGVERVDEHHHDLSLPQIIGQFFRSSEYGRFFRL